MLSQIATKVTVSLAFLSAALVFSPYPLLDQSQGSKPAQHGIVPKAEHLVQSSRQFAADVSKETHDIGQAELHKRAQKVDHFGESVAEAVQNPGTVTESVANVFESSPENASAHTEPSAEVEVAGETLTQGAESFDLSKDAVATLAGKVKEGGSAVVQSTADAAQAALHRASEAGAQADDAVNDVVDSVKSAPEHVKQGAVDGTHLLLDSVGEVKENVKEDVKQGVGNAQKAGQGLMEKLKSVTAHIRESSSWPEPEAIGILAEGVWAPKEDNPLPDLSNFLNPDRIHIDPEHTESSIEEKLGIHMGLGSPPTGKLQSFLFESRLWRSVKKLWEQLVRSLAGAWGNIHTASSGPSEVFGLTAPGLRVVHLAAVAVHFAVALGALGIDRSWLTVEKTASGSSRQRMSAWVESGCSVIALVTFLILYPWGTSRPEERNEVQVLVGTAVECLRRLIWESGTSEKPASVSSPKPSKLDAPDQSSSSPLPKKSNKRKSKKVSSALKDDLGEESTTTKQYGLSTLFSLLTRLSVVVALGFHLAYLISKLRASSWTM